MSFGSVVIYLKIDAVQIELSEKKLKVLYKSAQINNILLREEDKLKLFVLILISNTYPIFLFIGSF